MAFSTLRANRVGFSSVGRKASCAPRPAARSVVVAARAQNQDAKLELVKPVVVAAVANLIMAAPSFAEAGKIFDFNLTLPIMAGEFLVLMVFLEKTWFTPVGKILDARDGLIRDKLGSVKDNSGDVERLAAEAANILKLARSEATALINEKKTAKQNELDSAYNSSKAKVAAEVDAAIAQLDKESSQVLKKLDAQVEKISAEVLSRVVPVGVKI